MHIRRLHLENFRNFARLDLALLAGPSVVVGGNAQGKTNLLEAVHLLSTLRSPLAAADADLICWQAHSDPMPTARLVAEVQRRSDAIRVELVVAGYWVEAGALHANKIVRIGGRPRRAAEAIGQMTSVFFTAQDLELLTGPPSLRRRYLDTTIAQVDRAYLRALQSYGKVLVQRNHLLRRIQEASARPDELAYWDQELVREGAYIVRTRAQVVSALGRLAAEAQAALTGGREGLMVTYKPQVGSDVDGEATARLGEEEVAGALAAALKRWQPREIGAGTTLLGPHRDDLLFHIDGRPVAAFASRAQQRTIALSLRLAEAHYLRQRSDDAPILLLDDILSELDQSRRGAVLAAIAPYEQVLLTSTEVDRFHQEFLERAAVFVVEEGAVKPWQAPRGGAG
ncbi:MAG: DNA replication/repair protein RecF [Dehalococcoidia bacterium]